MADILQDTVEFYKHILHTDDRAISYLDERGIMPVTSSHFDLGSSGSGKEYCEYMVDVCKYDPELLESSGVVLITDNGLLPTFKDTLIIPFKDSEGRVVNISGRTLVNSKTKYRNLAHTPIIDFFGTEALKNRFKFNKIKNLPNYCFVCEGQIDTITLQQNGLFALGVLGVNNIRPKMFSHLEWFDNIVLAFDNDAPGDKARDQLAGMINHVYPDKTIWYIDYDYHSNPKGADVNSLFLVINKSGLLQSLKKLDNIKPIPIIKQPKTNVVNREINIRVEAAKRVPITEFVSSISKVRYRKSNRTLKSKCPFSDHQDSIGSFTIYTDNNSFYCFGCGRGGDVITFCREFFDISFQEAVELLIKWKRKR